MSEALLNNLGFDENDVLASICREDFYEFVKEFWDVVTAEKPVWNWHIKYLCEEIQKVAERVFADLPKEYDLIVNIPPGETKSTIASVMFPAWAWTRMPSAQFITASYGFNLATDLSRKSRDIIMSEKYQMAFVEIQLRPDQNVKTNYMNTKGGFRVAVGTGGVIGFHGHFIIIDDPIDPTEVASGAELRSTNVWLDETLSQRKVDKSKTPTILIMQRLHQDDPTAHLIKRAELAREIVATETDGSGPLRLKHVCLPAEKTEYVKPRKLRKYYKEDLLDVVRLSTKILNENKALGNYMYNCQFLQQPAPRGGSMFKVDRIAVEVLASNIKWTKRVRFWDKAGMADEGAYTVGVLMGKSKRTAVLPERFWVLDVVRGRWSAGARENIIRQTAEMDGEDVVIGIEQEPGSGGKESAENTIRNLAGFVVKIDKPSGSRSSKIDRADPFAVQVEAGVVVIKKAEWNSAYLRELQAFPHAGKYKDQVDSSSGAFNLLARPRRRAGVFKW